VSADHLKIWNALSVTDKKHTKPFTRAGGFKGTATKPIYLLQKMTETFGPCGTGWGYGEPTYQLVNGANNEVLVYCWVALWYNDPATGTRSEPFHGVGGDVVVKSQSRGLVNDDEAFKKAFTDALGNAMKHLGMSADVHMGQFDGSKYQADDHHEAPQQETFRPQRPQTVEMPRADLRLNVSSDASAARSEALGATVRQCGSLDALEALRADPSFKADFKALPLALQATVGEVIKKKRQQFGEAA